MATKQMFIGDEAFIDKARRRSATAAVREGHYSLKRIVGAVSEVMGIEEGDLRRPGRREVVQRSRELISCIARRNSDVRIERTRPIPPSQGVVDAESCGEAS